MICPDDKDRGAERSEECDGVANELSTEGRAGVELVHFLHHFVHADVAVPVAVDGLVHFFYFLVVGLRSVVYAFGSGGFIS